jgi:hypothetical protein
MILASYTADISRHSDSVFVILQSWEPVLLIKGWASSGTRMALVTLSWCPHYGASLEPCLWLSAAGGLV